MSDQHLVTADNFDRAESDRYFARYVGLGALGGFFHVRRPTPVDKQDVVRMNRDTLYSLAIFDLTTPVTIVLPDAGGRFQSLMPVSEDHSIHPCSYGAGEYTFTQEMMETRYAGFIVRTFVDANDPEDVARANALQDALEVRQAEVGVFEVPAWDQPSLDKVRSAYEALAQTLSDVSRCFGIKSRMDRLYHMIGTAAGWGGNAREDAMYDMVVPELNDGATPHVVSVKDVPVDGFWSITVYNATGFMEPNDADAYSFNNVTAVPDADGSITINFGGGEGAVNNLPITPGWNYAVRMYRPRTELLEGTWSFPRAQPVI